MRSWVSASLIDRQQSEIPCCSAFLNIQPSVAAANLQPEYSIISLRDSSLGDLKDFRLERNVITQLELDFEQYRPPNTPISSSDRERPHRLNP